MAGVTTKSSLAAALGNALAPEVKGTIEAPYKPRGFNRLPAGIKNGVAKLVKCYFEQLPADTKAQMWDGKKKVSAAGQWVFKMTGMVVEPRVVKTHDDGGNPMDVPVYGEMTQLNNGYGISVYDTVDAKGNVRTKGMNKAEIANEMKGIAGDDFVKSNMKKDSDLEKMAELLSDPKHSLYFKFSTTVKKAKTKRNLDGTEEEGEEGVYENWYGGKGLEDYVEPEPNAVDDHSGGDESEPQAQSNGQRQQTAPPAATGGPTATAAEQPFQESSGSVEDTLVELGELVATIETGDPAVEDSDANRAMLRLGEIAEAAGLPVDDESAFAQAENWAAAAQLVADQLQAAEGNGQAAEEPVKPLVPAKGGKVRYVVLDAKGNPLKDVRTKAPKPPVEAEVAAVYSKSETVDLKLPNGTVVKNVKWADLLP